jgi:transcriptional regulator with XRE-family HTH domain
MEVMEKGDFADMFSRALNEYANARGLSPRDLASRTGLSTHSIYAWMVGRRCPLVSHFLVLCDALQMSPDTFLDWPKNKTTPDLATPKEIQRIVKRLAPDQQAFLLKIAELIAAGNHE